MPVTLRKAWECRGIGGAVPLVQNGVRPTIYEGARHTVTDLQQRSLLLADGGPIEVTEGDPVGGARNTVTDLQQRPLLLADGGAIEVTDGDP